MFCILVVDDDRTTAYLLKVVMKNLQRPHELYFVSDGVEALDFLHCRGAYENVPRPHLILLDVQMPRLNGLETLAAIKNDPELCIIPVIMLSAGSVPEDVHKSYKAHANCFVQKPTDLERSVELVQAIGAFWIDFAVLPPCEERSPKHFQVKDSERKHSTVGPSKVHSGLTIAQELGGARSRVEDTSAAETATTIRRSNCEEHNRRLNVFGVAVRELLKLHEQQFLAIVECDTDCNRFDLLIHMANEKKQVAKYAYLRHVESHGCSNT